MLRLEQAPAPARSAVAKCRRRARDAFPRAFSTLGRRRHSPDRGSARRQAPLQRSPPAHVPCRGCSTLRTTRDSALQSRRSRPRLCAALLCPPRNYPVVNGRRRASSTAPALHLCGFAALDRHADERAVLGPAAVVVAHMGIAEQLIEDEPGVARTFTDAAVDRHLP